MTEGTTTWNYTYNSDGLRTKRTNGTTTYSYVYNGSSLTQMTVGSDTLYFAYDASGTPISVTYNGTKYYYMTNIQGDVLVILSGEGKIMVGYTYDAWGNILEITGPMVSTLGMVNPLRYRAYVFDKETGLYYLQSRYYNPEIGRFINADALISTGRGVLGYNMFAYCRSNPVSRKDVLGTDEVDCFDADVDPTDNDEDWSGGRIGGGGNREITVGGGGSPRDFSGKIGIKYNSDRGNPEASKTFLPKEYYSSNKAPTQSTPNSRLENYKYNEYTGEYEYSTAYYDNAGRLAIRIDWTNHGRADHGNPHVHMRIYNAEYRDGHKIDFY